MHSTNPVHTSGSSSRRRSRPVPDFVPSASLPVKIMQLIVLLYLFVCFFWFMAKVIVPLSNWMGKTPLRDLKSWLYRTGLAVWAGDFLTALWTSLFSGTGRSRKQISADAAFQPVQKAGNTSIPAQFHTETAFKPVQKAGHASIPAQKGGHTSRLPKTGGFLSRLAGLFADAAFRAPGTALLYGMCLSALFGSLFQIKYGFSKNLETILWMAIIFALFYNSVYPMSRKALQRYACIQYAALYLLWGGACCLSLVQFALQIGQNGPNHASSAWLGGDGFINHRLYGLFYYPEYGAVTGAAVILIGCFYIAKTRTRAVKILLAALQLPIFCYIVLSGSKNGLVSLYAGAFTASFLLISGAFRRTSGRVSGAGLSGTDFSGNASAADRSGRVSGTGPHPISSDRVSGAELSGNASAADRSGRVSGTGPHPISSERVSGAELSGNASAADRSGRVSGDSSREKRREKKAGRRRVGRRPGRAASVILSFVLSLAVVLFLHGLAAATKKAAPLVPALFAAGSYSSTSTANKAKLNGGGTPRPEGLPGANFFVSERQSTAVSKISSAASFGTSLSTSFKTSSGSSSGSFSGNSSGSSSGSSSGNSSGSSSGSSSGNSSGSSSGSSSGNSSGSSSGSREKGLLDRYTHRGDYSSGRLTIWGNYLSLWKDIGLFGLSPENASLFIQEHHSDLYIASYIKKHHPKSYEGGYVFHPHSGFLKVYVSAGLIGALLTTAWFALTAARAASSVIRQKTLSLSFIFSAATAAAGFSSALFDTELFFTKVPMTLLFWLAAAVLLRSCRNSSR